MEALGSDSKKLLAWLKKKFKAGKILGAGTAAVAFAAGRRRVVKITTDLDDATVAQRLMAPEFEQYQDVLARVFSVLELRPTRGDFERRLYVIEAERLYPLPASLRGPLKAQRHNVMKETSLGWQPRLSARVATEPAVGLGSASPILEALVYRKLWRLVQVSRAVGSDLVNDAHAGNWGLRKAKDVSTMALFDFGYSNTGGSSPPQLTTTRYNPPKEKIHWLTPGGSLGCGGKPDGKLASYRPEDATCGKCVQRARRWIAG
jgi:hypothetical protein